MAAWLLPLAALMSVGGIGAQAIGARQADRARADAMRAERARQTGFREEIEPIQDGNRQRYDQLPEQMEQRKSSIADLYGSAAPAADMLPKGDSNIVVDREAKERGEGRAFSGQQGQARASMRSFGDSLGDILRQQGRDTGDIATIQGFQRGSQGALPSELTAASGKGGGMRMLGSVLSGLGQVGVSAGLANPSSLPSLPSLFGPGSTPNPTAPGGLSFAPRLMMGG